MLHVQHNYENALTLYILVEDMYHKISRNDLYRPILINMVFYVTHTNQIN